MLLSSDPLVYAARRDPAGDAERGIPAPGPGVAVWRGLRVAPEEVCSEFSPEDYGVTDGGDRFMPYVFGLGAVSGRDPLTCAYVPADFISPGRRSRLVTVEEAHRRGLCRRSAAHRRHFVIDSGNVLPSALPEAVASGRERFGPGWLPPLNQCWYVGGRLRIHQRWGLTVPLEEARRFQAVLERCPAAVRVSPVCPASMDVPGR